MKCLFYPSLGLPRDCDATNCIHLFESTPQKVQFFADDKIFHRVACMDPSRRARQAETLSSHVVRLEGMNMIARSEGQHSVKAGLATTARQEGDLEDCIPYTMHSESLLFRHRWKNDRTTAILQVQIPSHAFPLSFWFTITTIYSAPCGERRYVQLPNHNQQKIQNNLQSKNWSRCTATVNSL